MLSCFAADTLLIEADGVKQSGLAVWTMDRVARNVLGKVLRVDCRQGNS